MALGPLPDLLPFREYQGRVTEAESADEVTDGGGLTVIPLGKNLFKCLILKLASALHTRVRIVV